MMNIYKFYGLIGPWATPAPAAIALAGRLYGEWATTDKLTGWGVAIFSLAALEVAGGLCSYQMIQASLSRRWGWFWACLFGVVAYLALGVYALWGVTAWIYVVLAVFVHISVAADLSSVQYRQETVEDKGLDLAFEKEKTKQAQAKAREAKAQSMLALPAPKLALPAPKLNHCQLCQQEFGSVQALNAHKRFCKGVIEQP